MPEENESLNYLLYIASLLDGKIKGMWKYAARILLSSIIRKELMNELSFEIIVKKGVEEGFLAIEDKDIILTSNGYTHLNYVFPKLKFSEEIKYQVFRIRDLEDKDKRIDYIKYLENELISTLEYSQKKRESPISEHILVNGYIGEIEGSVWTFSISNNEYISKQDFSAKEALIKKFVDEFIKKGYNCIYKLGYNEVTFFINKLPDKEVINFIIKNNFNFVQQIKETKINDLEKDEFEYLLSKLLSNFLISKKLVKIGRRLKFIDFTKKEIKKVRIAQLHIPLIIFYGFNIKVTRINKNKFILWIDPTYMQFLTIDNWIEATGIDSYVEIFKKVSEICVLPYKQKGKIKEINLEVSVVDEIKELWKRKYNLELTRKTGVAYVQFKLGKPYLYPLETLCFDKKWIENNIGFIIKETPVLSPQERYEKIKEWFNSYFKGLVETPFCKIAFKKDLANLDEIKEIFKSAYRLLPPILVFSQRDIRKQSTDTRAIFKYGGYAENKGIFIFKIICPSYISEKDCEEFLTALKRVYENTFGPFEYASQEIRISYSETLLNETYHVIEEKMKRKLEPILPPKDVSLTPIAIVVEPTHKHIFYYIVKSIINNYWRTPDQHIIIKKFKRIINRELPLLRGLCLQLYVKSLKANESPWILRYPSDGLAKSIYSGIGFSMQVKDSQVKKGVGILVICDSQGKFVYQKHLSLSEATNYLSEEMLQKLFSFVKDKTSNMMFQRLVIYKKGHLKQNECEILQKFIKQVKEAEYWKNKKIDVVTVEEDIYRLFKVRGQNILNVDSGLTVILNNQEALVCVSGHPEIGLKQGTAKLLHIKAETLESDTTIKELVREYYDRTFLNWTAPVTLSKYPPELNISQKIAMIAKEVDITQDFTYIVV
jgi:hypothetical protein